MRKLWRCPRWAREVVNGLIDGEVKLNLLKVAGSDEEIELRVSPENGITIFDVKIDPGEIRIGENGKFLRGKIVASGGNEDFLGYFCEMETGGIPVAVTVIHWRKMDEEYLEVTLPEESETIRLAECIVDLLGTNQSPKFTHGYCVTP